MKVSRREFGGALAGALGGWGCSSPEPAAGTSGPAAAKRIPIGVESWSVKEMLAADPEGSIAELAEMGYEGIELAHYYNWESLTADRVKKALDANGIGCCSVHLNIKTLEPGELERTIEYNKTIDNSVLILASLPHQETIAGWENLAKRVDELAAKVGEYGMRLGYHNHAGDFEPLEGQVPWEVFFNNTSDRVIHQLDVGNMPQQYQDPVKYLKMYPGRTQSIHVKDRSPEHEQALVGEGVLPFREIFDLCATIGGTEWYIVEYESDAYPGMEAVRRCLENVKKVLG